MGNSSSSSKPHVIVIGSGIAGMAAASQLAENGVIITVLESNDYIGGRTKTKNVQLSNNSNFAFDEGASWIHGSCSKHPITQLSKKINGVKLVETQDDSIINYDLEGEEVNKQVQKEYKAYEKMVDKMVDNSQDYQDLNVLDAFRKINPEKLNNKFFMYNASNDLEFNTSAPLQDLSAGHGQDDEEIEGTEMLICSGYQAFPQYLSKHQNIKVLLNHTVKQIIYSQEKSIVKCENGAIFQGQCVIIGVPLGVLKSRTIKFVPELPQWKQDAIRRIHFGNVCKILIVLKDKKIDYQEHYIGVVEDDVQKRGLATYFLNLSGLASLPALMTFGLGANADQLQNMPDKTLKELIASRLSVFGEEQFSLNDFQIIRTKWRNNPNFRGTYSYSGVQTKPKDWKNIAKPVFSNQWYFCGQHTHSLYRGTVHGAFLSGKDAASSIIGQLNQKNWKYNGALEQDDSESKQQNENRRPQKNENKKEQESSEQEDERKKVKKPRKPRKKQESSSSEDQK